MSIKINAGSISGGSISGGNGDVTITTSGSVSGLNVAGGRVTVNGREVPSGVVEVPAPKTTPPTLAQLARAEMEAYKAHAHALDALVDAMKRIGSGEHVVDARQIQARAKTTGEDWGDAMDALDAALEVAGRAPIVGHRGRRDALEALIQEEASP